MQSAQAISGDSITQYTFDVVNKYARCYEIAIDALKYVDIINALESINVHGYMLLDGHRYPHILIAMRSFADKKDAHIVHGLAAVLAGGLTPRLHQTYSDMAAKHVGVSLPPCSAPVTGRLILFCNQHDSAPLAEKKEQPKHTPPSEPPARAQNVLASEELPMAHQRVSQVFDDVIKQHLSTIPQTAEAVDYELALYNSDLTGDHKAIIKSIEEQMPNRASYEYAKIKLDVYRSVFNTPATRRIIINIITQVKAKWAK